MNREEALARFAGENGKPLTDLRATKELVRVLRERFATKHSLDAASRFTQREAAEHVLRQIVQARRDTDVDGIVELITRIPWISDSLGEGRIRQQVGIYRLGSQPVLSASDLSHLNEEKYLSNVEEKIADKVRAVATRQLADEHSRLAKSLEALRAKHEDLDAKRSILESIAPEKGLALERGEVNPQELQLPATVWWQDIGLSSDPFLTNRGIYHIPKDKFESIVVETPFIKNFSDRIAASPTSFLSQAVLILGQYGSGKSTLFDILERKASPRRIIPLLIELSPSPSTPGLLEVFFTQLGERLGEAFPDTFGGLPARPSESPDMMGACIKAMQSALEAHPTTLGFYVLIDGLHKPDIFRSQTFEFVQYLQTFEERLDRTKVPCGFFIAGLPDWARVVESDKALQGSITEIAPIPELSVENAVEAVVRRITSFALPGGTPPQVVRLPLRRGFEVLAERLCAPPNFREYLDDIKARLISRDFESVGISITLHLETIQAIKTTFEDSGLGSQYRRLMDPTLHSPAFRSAVKMILPAMVSEGGVPESSTLFSGNIGAFFVLFRENFIVKRWDVARGGVVWHLAEEVIPLLQQLETEEEVLPTEALEALFVDPRAAPRAESGSIYGSVLVQLKEMISTWSGSWETVAQFVDSAERRIREISNSLETEQSFHVSVDLVRKSLIDLAMAVLEAIGESPSTLEDVPGLFESLWCAPEDAREISNLMRLPAEAGSSLPSGLGILHRHAGASRTLCDLLSDLVAGEGLAPMRGRRLSEDEKRRIHEARTSFLAQQFQAAVDCINDATEKKIRDVLFVRWKCLGPADPVGLLSDHLRREIDRAGSRGPPKLRRTADRNFLYDISRGAYSQVLYQPVLRAAAFAIPVSDAESNRLSGETALLFGLGSKEVHNQRPRYFIDHSQDISRAIAFCIELTEMLNDSIAQLLDESRIQLKLSSEGGIDAEFRLPDGSRRTCSVGREHAKSIGHSVVERLRRDRIRIPPLETALMAIAPNVDDALVVILAALNQGLVDQARRDSPFSIDLTLVSSGQGPKEPRAG